MEVNKTEKTFSLQTTKRTGSTWGDGRDGIWTCFNQFGQVWANLDKFDPFWTSLIQFGQVWSNLNKFDPIWTCLIHFGQIWSNLDKFDPIWTSLIQYEQFDPFWTSLIHFGHVWSNSEISIHFGQVWSIEQNPTLWGSSKNLSLPHKYQKRQILIKKIKRDHLQMIPQCRITP